MLLLLNQSWLYLATAIFAALIAWYVGRRPGRPGIRQFRMMLVVWMAWALAATLQTITRSLAINYWLWVFQSLCALVGIPLELLMTLAYTGSEKWIARSSMRFLFLPAVLFLILAITVPNAIATMDIHSEIVVFSASGLTLGIFVGYIFVLILSILGVLFASLLRAPAFRIPIILIILGQILTVLGYLISSRLSLTVSPIQFTSLLINLAMLAYFVAFFNYRLLRVVPVARDAIITQMPNALFVLDAENYLVDFNPITQALPGMPEKLTLQKPAEKVLGSWWEEIATLIGPEAAVKDSVIHTLKGTQIFQVRSLPLLQPSGWRMAQAFILEDVTQARQAQQQMAQLQWAQATLQERELLADELHDSLAQNLAFLNVQVQAAQLYLQTGQVETAQTSLNRLTEAVEQIQEDTREMIDHLLSVSLPAENFCITLYQMLKSFEKQTGLATQLYLAGEAAKEDCYEPTTLPPWVAVQLVSITQEALTNVRKHAHGSSQVLVKLKATEKLMELTITDDGAGFEPISERTDGKHFGLQIMRQRAARIGGQVAIESAPGKGTRIEVSVPLTTNGPGSSR